MNTEANLISAEEFNQLIKQAAPVFFIDVRTAAEIHKESISGSINLPLQTISSQQLATSLKLENHPENAPVYILCGTGKRAALAAEKLTPNTNHPLVIISGGIHAFKLAGGNVINHPDSP